MTQTQEWKCPHCGKVLGTATFDLTQGAAANPLPQIISVPNTAAANPQDVKWNPQGLK